MGIDKIAVLILTAVIAFFLGWVIFSADDRGKQGRTARTATKSPADEQAKGSRTTGRVVDFETARKGGYSSASVRPTPEKKDPTTPPAASTRREPAADPAADVARDPAGQASTRVKAGETLWSISKRVYGSALHYSVLVAANPQLDPKRLRAGEEVIVPDLTAEPEQKESAAALAAGQVHEVRRNETLSGISKRYYLTTTRWRDILAANRGVLQEPTALRPGMVLVIP